MDTLTKETKEQRKVVKEKVDIHDYLIDLYQLAHKVKRGRKEYEGIYGVPRGGLIPAVYLSHILGIELFVDLCDVTSDFLIVDDLLDTGSAYRTIMENLDITGRLEDGPPDWAVIYVKPWCPFKATYSIKKTENWIIFPYEDLHLS